MCFIGHCACFETRPGRAGSLLSMRALGKIPHPEVPREARPRRTQALIQSCDILTEPLSCDPAELLGYARKVDDIDRIKRRGFLKLVMDRRKSRAGHRRRSFNADVDIRSLGSRSGRTRAEHEDTIARIGDVPPYHRSGELGGFGGISDRSHLAHYFSTRIGALILSRYTWHRSEQSAVADDGYRGAAVGAALEGDLAAGGPAAAFEHAGERKLLHACRAGCAPRLPNGRARSRLMPATRQPARSSRREDRTTASDRAAR